MITAGSALAVVGVALVIVGWIGTSRTILVAGQIPYVVSGGLLGLGLVFLGGFLYFAYWLALLVRQSRDQAERGSEDLARIEAGLAEATQSLAVIAKLLAEGAAPANGAVPSRRRRAATPALGAPRTITVRADRLVATPAGSMVHHPSCPIVANRGDLHDVDPGRPGLRRCGMCLP
ncbi:MAG: hypothetical protein ACYDH6_19355 [Acidimicrobiales bacterium]